MAHRTRRGCGATVVKLRHAAALAAVGWYLMTPPPQPDPATGLPNGGADVHASFRWWDNEGSFDSAKECRAELERNIKFMMQLEAKISRERHQTEQQQLEDEDKHDHAAKLPKGWSHGMRHFGLIAATHAECIASDDPRLKGN